MKDEVIMTFLIAGNFQCRGKYVQFSFYCWQYHFYFETRSLQVIFISPNSTTRKIPTVLWIGSLGEVLETSGILDTTCITYLAPSTPHRMRP